MSVFSSKNIYAYLTNCSPSCGWDPLPDNRSRSWNEFSSTFDPIIMKAIVNEGKKQAAVSNQICCLYLKPNFIDKIVFWIENFMFYWKLKY